MSDLYRNKVNLADWIINSKSNSIINADYLDGIHPHSSRIELRDDTVVVLDDVNITGKELKICIKYLIEIAKNNKPEEFI